MIVLVLSRMTSSMQIGHGNKVALMAAEVGMPSPSHFGLEVSVQVIVQQATFRWWLRSQINSLWLFAAHVKVIRERSEIV